MLWLGHNFDRKLLVTLSNAGCCCCCCCWLAAVVVSVPQQLPPAVSSGGTSCEGHHSSNNRSRGQMIGQIHVLETYREVDARAPSCSIKVMQATPGDATQHMLPRNSTLD
jgi:hypothetical protein